MRQVSGRGGGPFAALPLCSRGKWCAGTSPSLTCREFLLLRSWVPTQVPESAASQLPAPLCPASDPNQYSVRTTVGTFNAQTLRSSGSLDVLLHELREQQCSVLGVQEARFSDARSFESGNHIVITSACTEQGQQGCALILSKEVPYARVGSKALFFDSRQVFVVISEPSILIVKVAAPGLHLLCVVAHAPHCLRSETDRASVSKRTSTLGALTRATHLCSSLMPTPGLERRRRSS